MSKKLNFLIFLIIVLLGVNIFAPNFSIAQSLTPQRKAELEQELKQIENEIAEQRVILEAKQKERTSLERDVAILDAKIQESKLQIRATDLKIQSLTREIGNKALTIEELNAKVIREKESLSQIIRKTNEIDSVSLVEIVLGNQNFSEFFEDIDSFSSIKASLRNSFREIEDTRNNTETEKRSLEITRADVQELRNLQVVQRQRVESQEAEKQALLKATKGEESAYQQIIADKQKTAAQIRAALFNLRDSTAIPFGTALEYAKRAEDRTGVRAAFILGILAQESNLGENVGTGNWIDDMHPERDRPVFQVVADTLGFNPDTMPVSRAPWYGWGGAMGPAQFIPSTWACYAGYINSLTGSCRWGKGYTGSWSYSPEKDNIRKLLGISSPSNPWNAEHAIMAAADLLADNGGSGGNYNSERLAALRYFAGWTNATKPQYAFYGNDVMELATYYQGQINILEGN